MKPWTSNDREGFRDTRRGVAVLKTLPQDKIVWNAQGISGPIEFGSTSAVAWLREDLALIIALANNPGATGNITLARGGISLEHCLEDTIASMPILNGNTKLLMQLFTQAQLRMPAGVIKLPPWPDIKKVYLAMGLRAKLTLDVASVAHQTASRNGNTWAEYVKAYRLAVVQELIRIAKLPQLGTRITSAFVEDIILDAELGDTLLFSPEQWIAGIRTSRGGLAQQIASAMGIYDNGSGIRIINFPCQNTKNPCENMHFIDIHGRQRGHKGLGDEVPKRCRLKNLRALTLSDIFALGGCVSGAALYYLWGQLGERATFSFLTQDYSRGGVYAVLGPAFNSPTNRAKAIPFGAFYVYSKGCDPKKSIDSLVFLELLMRNVSPERMLRELLGAVPLPYSGPVETYVEIDKDGTLTIKKKEV